MAQILTPAADASTLVAAIEPANGETFSLEEVQAAVGGYIEAIRLDEPGHILLVDEDGRMKGLQINLLASLLAGRMLVGPAVFCAVRDDGEMVALADYPERMERPYAEA